MPDRVLPPSALPPAVLSTFDAAAYLGLAPQTLNSWRTLGKGPRYVRLGRGRARIVYLVDDLDDFLKAREAPRTTGGYTARVRERAIKTMLDHLDEYPSVYKAALAIGPEVGVKPDSLRRWVRAELAKTAAEDGRSWRESERAEKMGRVGGPEREDPDDDGLSPGALLPAALSTADAAAYLGLSGDTLTSWRSLGKGPRYVRLGRFRARILYRVRDLDDFLRTCAKKTM